MADQESTGGGAGPLPGQATRQREDPSGPGDVGREPDPRFSFANERTFLAWNRTALSLIAAGAAAAAFLRSGVGGARLLVALPLILLGSVLAFTSFGQWSRTERALRQGEPVPYHSRLSRVLAWGIALIAIVTALLAIVDLFVQESAAAPPGSSAPAPRG